MKALGVAALAAAALCACGDSRSEKLIPKDTTKFEYFALQEDVPLYELSVSSEAMGAFAADLWSEPQPAKFTAGGRTYDVKVRLRGSSSRFFEKKSWRIEMPSGVEFEGRDDINLLAEYQDATFMTEKMAYDMLAAMGVPAPRAKFVRLSINGKSEGVFVDLEHVDKHFLKSHGFADPNANIYRCGFKDCEVKTWRTGYQGDWEKKTNEKEPKDDIRQFVELVNHAPEPKFRDLINEKLDLPAYFKVMAMDALISNDIQQDSRSYFVHDRVNDRWVYVPWDLNNNDARWWPTYALGMQPVVTHPIYGYSAIDGWVQKMHDRRKAQIPNHVPAFSNLTTRIAFHPELREYANETIEHALDDLFTPEVMYGRIDAMYDLITPFVREDPYVDQAKFAEGREYLKAYVKRRGDFVRAELKRLREYRPVLVIERVDPQAGTIDLRNRNEVAVYAEGFTLTNDLRDSNKRNLPALTVQPGKSVRLSAAQLGFTLQPDGEVGLFDGTSAGGAVDVLFYGALDGGRHYERDGEGRWSVR